MKLVTPMEPILVDEIKDSVNTIHQIKWDGIRIMSYLNNGSLELYTKRGNLRTKQYPEIKQLLELEKVSSVIFDGEVICIKNSKPSFRQVVIRNRTTKEISINQLMMKYPAYYVIFDILELNGVDMRNKSFSERHELLNKLVTSSDRIKLAENYDDGKELYNIVKENTLEGIVSKEINSSYIAGKTHNLWYKYKLSRKILCVICGIHLNNDHYPKSIILGINSEEGLVHVGSASSGLTGKDIELLQDFKEKLRVDTIPILEGKSVDKNIIWFQPILTCWISFMEWTEDGIMRHPKIIGFSDLKMERADGTEYVK